MEEKSVIKSVFCSYRGSLIVYDVHGNRVDHLCDKMTLEIYNEIEERSVDGITTFDGLEKYRCVVCELKEEQENGEGVLDPFYDRGFKVKPKINPIINTRGVTPLPTATDIGDIWCDNLTGVFRQWDGNSWNIMTATGGVLTGGPPQTQKPTGPPQTQRQPTAPYSPFGGGGVITPYSNPNK